MEMFFLGVKGKIYNQLSVYNDILNIKGFLHKEIKSNKIINFIKQSIQENNYIILECNYSILGVENTTEELYIHELIIFGYDDIKKVFLCPILGKKGWDIEEIPYIDIEKAYSYLDKIDINKIGQTLLYKREYHYPINLIKVKNGYSYDDNIFLLYYDILELCNETKYKYTNNNLKNDVEFYDGYLACIQDLINAGEKILLNNYSDKEYFYSTNIRKIIDYREILYERINYLFKINNITLNNIVLLDKYITNKLYIAFNLALKYDLNGNGKNIDVVVKNLIDFHENERIVLSKVKEIMEKFILENY